MRLFGDLDPATGLSMQEYVATGGASSIGSVDDLFAAELTDQAFARVTVDPTTFVSTPVPGACTTATDSAGLVGSDR